MPHAILKKTFKTKPSGFSVANEKFFTFFGSGVTKDVTTVINHRLENSFKYAQGAKLLQFKVDAAGHYEAIMNHDFQKYHEEDAVVVILDAMEEFGWEFRFQYDTESFSSRVGGSSVSRNEQFIFHKAKK